MKTSTSSDLRLPLPRRREDEDVIARFRDLAEIAKQDRKIDRLVFPRLD